VVVKPVANFTSNVISGNAPLTVAFTDISSGSPTKWKWTFGDGTTSTTKNPKHKYLVEGNYTVSLKATNDAGSNTKTVKNYIKVTPTNTRPGIYSKNK
jgi:PKD repeat protein